MSNTFQSNPHKSCEFHWRPILTVGNRISRRLEGKIAIITGGASGLGKATAREFIREGAAAVFIADVNSDLGAEAAAELGPRAHFVRCDVADEGSVAPPWTAPWRATGAST